MLCNTGSAKKYWWNIALTLRPFFTTILETTRCWESNAKSWFNLIYIPEYIPIFFDKYSYNMCETKSSDNINGISCSFFFLGYLVWWLPFYFCNLCLMSILIFHMFHNQKKNVFRIDTFRIIHFFLTWFFQVFWYELNFLDNNMSICRNIIQIYIYRSIVGCCVWSIFLYITKISIYSHRIWSLYINKPLCQYHIGYSWHH